MSILGLKYGAASGPGTLGLPPIDAPPRAGSTLWVPGNNVDPNPPAERWGLEGREALGPIPAVTGVDISAFQAAHRGA